MQKDLIKQAGQAIKEGKLVVFPTETVYGLGADATNEKAILSIYQTKGRPSFNPLITHVAYKNQVQKWAVVPLKAKKLMKAFWPGPLTLVLNRQKDCPISKLVSAGLETIAVRMPRHPIAQKLIKASGLPICAPSANPFGKLSPTKTSHLAPSILENTAVVLEGGDCAVGVESTVLLMTEKVPVLLRAGGITKEQIESVLKMSIQESLTDEKAPKSPGQLMKHYAPKKPIRMNVLEPEKDETYLSFGNGKKGLFNLSPRADVQEVAYHLFDYLHLLDTLETVQKIAVAPIPEYGIGIAVNDRLKRAVKK